MCRNIALIELIEIIWEFTRDRMYTTADSDVSRILYRYCVADIGGLSVPFLKTFFVCSFTPKQNWIRLWRTVAVFDVVIYCTGSP